jgi:hypothetical protein
MIGSGVAVPWLRGMLASVHDWHNVAAGTPLSLLPQAHYT